MMYGWDGWGWGGWILMTVVMVLFWATLITAIVLVVRYLPGSRHTTGSPPGYGPSRPEEVLAERFARGARQRHVERHAAELHVRCA